MQQNIESHLIENRVFKPSKELRAMVAGIDLADFHDEEEELETA